MEIFLSLYMFANGLSWVEVKGPVVECEYNYQVSFYDHNTHSKDDENRIVIDTPYEPMFFDFDMIISEIGGGPIPDILYIPDHVKWMFYDPITKERLDQIRAKSEDSEVKVCAVPLVGM